MGITNENVIKTFFVDYDYISIHKWIQFSCLSRVYSCVQLEKL